MRHLLVTFAVLCLLWCALLVGAWLAVRDPAGMLLVQPLTGYAGELQAVDLEHARGFVVGKRARK